MVCQATEMKIALRVEVPIQNDTLKWLEENDLIEDFVSFLTKEAEKAFELDLDSKIEELINGSSNTEPIGFLHDSYVGPHTKINELESEIRDD